MTYVTDGVLLTIWAGVTELTLYGNKGSWVFRWFSLLILFQLTGFLGFNSVWGFWPILEKKKMNKNKTNFKKFISKSAGE